MNISRLYNKFFLKKKPRIICWQEFKENIPNAEIYRYDTFKELYNAGLFQELIQEIDIWSKNNGYKSWNMNTILQDDTYFIFFG